MYDVYMSINVSQMCQGSSACPICVCQHKTGRQEPPKAKDNPAVLDHKLNDEDHGG